MIFLIQIYRTAISPFLKPCCRFYPTCSVYAKIALKNRGVFWGLYFIFRRLLRCHPLHSGGFDPPPDFKARDS